MTNLKPGDSAIWAPYAARPKAVRVVKVTDNRITVCTKPTWLDDTENVREDMLAQYIDAITRMEFDIETQPWGVKPWQLGMDDPRLQTIAYMNDTIERVISYSTKELESFIPKSVTIHERVFKAVS